MKKALLSAIAICTFLFSYSQEVIEYNVKVDEENENPVSAQPKMGEEMEFDWYYTRRTGLQVDEVIVKYNNIDVRVTPSMTNRDTATKTEWWKEVGQIIRFSGKARVLGVLMVFESYDRDEGSDNYDITLYRTADGLPTSVPYGNKVYSGDEITTGTIKDSFTYIEFGTSDITDVTYDFVIGATLQEVTTFGDNQDDLALYTSKNGDGNGEKNALVKIEQSSLLASSKLPFGETEVWLRLDEVFKDENGDPFIFDYDFMIIPVMDVDVISDERIDLGSAAFKGHYPNPANESFNIKLTTTEVVEKVQIEIFSMGGQLISTQSFSNVQIGEQALTINSSSLETGTYLYTLDVDGKKVTSQVTVQK